MRLYRLLITSNLPFKTLLLYSLVNWSHLKIEFPICQLNYKQFIAIKFSIKFKEITYALIILNRPKRRLKKIKSTDVISWARAWMRTQKRSNIYIISNRIGSHILEVAWNINIHYKKISYIPLGIFLMNHSIISNCIVSHL